MWKLRRFGAAASSWWRDATRYDTWNVGIVTLDRELTELDQLRHLPAPRWLPAQRPLFSIADPFPYRHSGREWLLVEAYGEPKGVYGRIVRLDPLATTPAIEPVIAPATHVSYPFTFEDDGISYCVPENAAAGGCVVYRLHDDGSWRAEYEILADRRLIDPTIFRHGDRWWLIATDASGGGSEALHAFHAEALSGPWVPHRRNPIKVNRSSARPAGRPFTLGGRLYRPAQDCRVTYGGAIHVMEIEALTPETFRERIALRLEPDRAWPYPDGLHTLVVDGRRVYLDAKRTRYDNWRWLKIWTVSGWERRR